jgi:hypothetical protein
MSCPGCDRLDGDDRLISEAIEKRRETPRYTLTDDDRRAVEVAEEERSSLLQRIIERRAG